MSQLFSGKDSILLLWPICVASDTKNADLRRFIEGPATWSDETCNEIIIYSYGFSK